MSAFDSMLQNQQIGLVVDLRNRIAKASVLWTIATIATLPNMLDRWVFYSQDWRVHVGAFCWSTLLRIDGKVGFIRANQFSSLA